MTRINWGRPAPRKSTPPRARYEVDPRWAPRLVARDRYAHPLVWTALIVPVVLLLVAAGLLAGYLERAGWAAPPPLDVVGLLSSILLVGLALWSVRSFVAGRRRAARAPVPLAVGRRAPQRPSWARWRGWISVGSRCATRWASDDEGDVRRWHLSVIPARGPKAGQRVSIKDEQVLVTLEAVVDVIQAYCDVTMVTDQRA